MSKGYKRFVEKYLEKNEYSQYIFKVSYTFVPKGEGIWFPSHQHYYETFSLDKEDLEYLYNKYKGKAIQEGIEDKQAKARELTKSINDLQENIQKKQKELESLKND